MNEIDINDKLNEINIDDEIKEATVRFGKSLTERLSADYISNYIKQKIDYLENLASIETNEGRWREEEKYLYAISILEEIVEYIETDGGRTDADSN